jgi:hypothetical protein
MFIHGKTLELTIYCLVKSFGGDWNKVPSPASSSDSATVSSSPGRKKVPPPPPVRKYYPYSFESNNNNESNKSKTKSLQFGDNNETPLASSPSYLASQLKKVEYLIIAFIN